MSARKLTGALVAGLLTSSLVVPMAHAQPECAGPDGPPPTHTFEVKVKVAKDLYHLGEDAKFSVRVHRVVEGHDLGPVQGAEVHVGVWLGNVRLADWGMTDETGRASIRVRLERHAPAGLADVKAFAAKMIADAPCHRQYEYGEVLKLGVFRVAR